MLSPRDHTALDVWKEIKLNQSSVQKKEQIQLKRPFSYLVCAIISTCMTRLVVSSSHSTFNRITSFLLFHYYFLLKLTQYGISVNISFRFLCEKWICYVAGEHCIFWRPVCCPFHTPCILSQKYTQDEVQDKYNLKMLLFQLYLIFSNWKVVFNPT